MKFAKIAGPVGSVLLALAVGATLGCGSKESGADTGGDATGGRGGGRPGEFGGAPESTAIPIDVAVVAQRDIADYIETNGTLEAENDVDIVARIGGPVVELKGEEGMFVREGDLLARIDPEPAEAQLELLRVTLEEARLALERANATLASGILSQEAYDQAVSRHETAKAQIRSQEIQLEYTEIRAPFSGQIVERAIKFAENISVNQRLFRLSDFDPLLCPIQVPEKDLPSLRLRQSAYVTVDSYPDRKFNASVLRISPVVESATGTVKVTLSVQGENVLRPGMFASVFLEVDRRSGSLVIPKRALVLESIGDTVYVFDDGVARRREVELGFAEADSVEVTSGLEEGERVIVVGQDSVSDGTAVYVLADSPSGPPPGATGSPGFGGGEMSAEQLDMIKDRMRERGMSDAQIEERLQQMRNGASTGAGPSGAEREGRPPEGGDPPPQREGAALQETAPSPQGAPDADRSGRRGPPPGFDPTNMTDEQLNTLRERMKARGLSDEQIEERIERMKKGELPQRGPDEGPPGSQGPPGSRG